MAQALSLAARGLGNVWPNPAVGCVLVRDGRLVGRGWTRPGGRPHAEAEALKAAGPAARGATAYVTLEPCVHEGRGPACTGELIRAGIARAVVATLDPDPRTKGQGIAGLRAAGIEVTSGVLEAEARRLNAGFFTRIALGRPWVTLKLAMTLDGRIATASGQSRWITGPEARRRVHAMRLGHDAVMVGIRTAMADDPELTVRGFGTVPQPVRIVIDSHLRLPPGGKLARGAGEAPIWLCHAAGDGAGAPVPGARLIPCPLDADGYVDLMGALQRLGSLGLTRVLCEGGARIAAALLRLGLADELAVFTAGRTLGADAWPGVAGLPPPSELGPPAFRLEAVETVGTDLLHRWVRDA